MSLNADRDDNVGRGPRTTADAQNACRRAQSEISMWPQSSPLLFQTFGGQL